MTSRKHHGTYNVLADLEFPDAEELTAKTCLAKTINDMIADLGLSQLAAANLTGMRQPTLSAIRSYRIRNLSLEQLTQALIALRQHDAST